MDFSSISIILLGSTFGLILRIFIQNNFKKSIGFDIQNTSIVNFLSSFFLGILVALNFINNEILVLFYSGFLGCFSTFSSFTFLVGFFVSKRLSYSTEKILLSGFFSCFTSFSGFIYFLYKILNQGDWIKFIIFFNLIIIVNLFTMLFGFWISRKIT